MKNQDKKIERCNLTRQVNALLPQYIEEVTNIFQSGKYVLGHKLQMFERTFAFHGSVFILQAIIF